MTTQNKTQKKNRWQDLAEQTFKQESDNMLDKINDVGEVNYQSDVMVQANESTANKAELNNQSEEVIQTNEPTNIKAELDNQQDDKVAAIASEAEILSESEQGLKQDSSKASSKSKKDTKGQLVVLEDGKAIFHGKFLSEHRTHPDFKQLAIGIPKNIHSKARMICGDNDLTLGEAVNLLLVDIIEKGAFPKDVLKRYKNQ